MIESFAENTGFMWDIAEEFKAMLVFAEHRYYGDSLPFGEESKSKDPTKVCEGKTLSTINLSSFLSSRLDTCPPLRP